MGKRKRKISCGRYTAEYVFSRVTCYDCPKARAEKRHHTSQVQQALNDKNALIYNAAVIAGTFIDDSSAQFVTLTFDREHYPEGRVGEVRSSCRRQLANFIARAQRLASRRGAAFAYGWAEGVGEEGRLHFHLLAKGLNREDLITVWGLGNVDTHYLRGDTAFLTGRDWCCQGRRDVNPEAIARYMIDNAKPLRKVGGRLIHFSRNCVRPVVSESRPVPDGYRLEAPEGCVTCDQRSERTMYSDCAFVSYLRQPPRRAGRRRKPRGKAPSDLGGVIS